jgi:hypothetical protein
VVADCTLSPENKPANLPKRGFLPRMPTTLKLGAQVVTHARAGDTWQSREATTCGHRSELCHSGMAQRWLVVSSQATLERAEATVSQARQRAL